MAQYLILGAFVMLILFLIQKYVFGKQPFWDKHGITTLKVESMILRLLKRESFIATQKRNYDRMGALKIAGFHDTGFNTVLIKDLDLTKQIYVKDFDHFVNRRTLRFKDKNINEVLTNKNDKEWKDLRATLTPAFSTGKIRRMFPILKESSEKFVTYVNKLVEPTNGGQINMQEAVGRYCLDSVTSVAFGIDCEIYKENSYIASQAMKLNPQFTLFFILQLVFYNAMPKWMNKFQSCAIDPEANEVFSKIISDTIKRRETSGERRNDFVQLMIDAKHGQLQKDEENIKLDSHEKDAQLNDNDKNRKQVDFTDELIIGNCMVFIIGGLDTTKSVANFGVYALSLNTRIQEKLRSELEKAIEENGGELTYDICNQQEYLEKFINETLRMYPPGLGGERVCTKDYQIPGTSSFIPKGSVAQLPIYLFHHDERYFPNPQVFDPERFSPEAKAQRHPYAYAPFGHGPRNCIASRFALVMAKAVVASIVLNFDIEPSEKTMIPMKYKSGAFLQPTEDIHLKLTPRK